MDAMTEIRVTFFQECDEQLAALEAGLISMDEGGSSAETVNAVFRAVHSIKGGAGAFKLEDLVSFAHRFETVLDQIRGGNLAPEAEVMKVLLRAADVLSDLVHEARDGMAGGGAAGSAVAAELQALLKDGDAEEGEEPFHIDFAPVVQSFGGPAGERYQVTFKPHRTLFEKANEPIALLRELARLGETEVTCDASAVPLLDALDPGEPRLAWSVVVSTEMPEPAIREAFEFVDGDCDLTVARIPMESSFAEIAAESEAEPRSKALPAEAAGHPAPGKGQADTKAVPAKAAAAQPTIRVDLDRVDRLINLVGELVINQAMLSQRVHQSGHGNDAMVTTSLEELEQLTRELQESVMAIRAQPVKPLFQRMSRILREVAEATGKQVRLRTEGEATEVDKTVLELLADPLTHMIRNAVDHGLEPPEGRAAAGKPDEGVVRLSAAHRSGRVIIEVADDGAGIDRPKVLDAAIQKGLVSKDAELSDSEIDNLLFLPGFSTANSVSSISGRGVGMDVVKRSIQTLGGRISISSSPREGSTFTLSMPLTMAVLDGIVVSISGHTFVIPLTAIVETLKPEPGWLHSLGEDAVVMQVRGKFVPLIDVGAELGVREPGQVPPGGVAILVETEKGSRSALLVDGIQDQRQVVIKSLETNYGRAPGVAAATILGDGRVAMILDVDGLIGKRRPAPGGPDAAEPQFQYALAG